MIPFLLAPLALLAQTDRQHNTLEPMRPEWKLCAALQSHSNAAHRGRSLSQVTPAELRIPEYALAGMDAARVVVRYAANATPAEVSSALVRLGLREVEVVETFRAAYAWRTWALWKGYSRGDLGCRCYASCRLWPAD